ncbi:MAG: acetamidase/formamidase family protein [Promethearchaeota archaeon]|jgi:acetamidase/formamidase
MKEIKQPDNNYNYVFSSYHEPIACVKSGEAVIVYTEDAFEGRICSPSDLPSKILKKTRFLNPQTGPIFVDGAESGDVLKVKIESIEPIRDFAVSCFIPYFGGLTSTNFTRTLQNPIPEKVWIWKLLENKYFYNDEIKVKVPLDPFLGTFAVAPELEAISSLTPSSFGGNMDVPDVKPDNIIYLPVYNEGALFYTGDCHGNQGEGELCGVALEIPCKATLRFDLIKSKNIAWPRIESPKEIMVVGSARPMEDAARIAYTELVIWLAEDYGFDHWSAYELLTQVGRLNVGNMVDTNYSLVAKISKKYLSKINLTPDKSL